jgi:nucleoid-associated protein YgaU
MIINQIQQPRPFDLVGDRILIAGVGSGFEGVLNYRVHDGHDERTGSFNVGGTGILAQFQIAVDVTGAAFQLDRLFVEIFEESASGDGSELNKASVPVILGSRITPNFIGYMLHEVKRGDTLTAISRQYYGDPNHVNEIVRANPVAISNPNVIIVGQVLKIPIGA